MYEILPYTKRKAKQLNVFIVPSKKKNKKIDVYNKRKEFIVSIGARGYGDYPTYLKYFGKEYADNRRKLYKKRHERDRHIKGTAGFYADKLLW
jgi:hypothetical protein